MLLDFDNCLDNKMFHSSFLDSSFLMEITSHRKTEKDICLSTN